MATDNPDYDGPEDLDNQRVKVICLGDSAVGKSKLVERFLMDGYQPQQLSTFALTLFRYNTQLNSEKVCVDFWDTAGQERFSSVHPSYYHQAHACILVFDITRKITYKNLTTWLKELREYRPEIPCICAANKIDVDYSVTKKAFNFAKKHGMPFYFVSASDGTNVVKLFREAIKAAVQYKINSTDFMDEVMKELENFDIDPSRSDDWDSGLESGEQAANLTNQTKSAITNQLRSKSSQSPGSNTSSPQKLSNENSSSLSGSTSPS